MHVVIVGNGISGITAARHIRKWSDYQITVISRETDYFFSRTALMYIYMGHMRVKDTMPYDPEFYDKNRINLIRGQVQKIDFRNRLLHLDPSYRPESNLGQAPEQLSYDRLILALGSATNKFGWPGQDLKRVQGLYSMADLENMEEVTPGIQRAVVVGGGLIGIEMAEMFHSRGIPVTMLVREENYWDIVLPFEESRMVSRHILRHGIDLRLATELKEIKGNAAGEAIAVVTSGGEEIPCEFVGLTAGVHPNMRWLKDTELETDRGILVDDHLRTNIPEVYAAGDCVQLRNPRPGRRNIEAVWYTGRMMGEVVAHNICRHPVAYDPGIWFNSAKFFDIEYQVYGSVPTRMPDHLSTLYWEEGEKSIRFVFEKESEVIVGFNLMGIRFRHEVCEKWIREVPLSKVISNLELAFFDPEFFRQYQREAAILYREKTGKQIPPALKVNSFDRVFKFLGSK